MKYDDHVLLFLVVQFDLQIHVLWLIFHIIYDIQFCLSKFSFGAVKFIDKLG